MIFAGILAIWALCVVAAHQWAELCIRRRKELAAVRLLVWERTTGPGNIGPTDRVERMRQAYDLRPTEAALQNASILCGPALLLAYLTFN